MFAIWFMMCIQCTDKHTAQLNFPKNRWYQSDVLSLDFNNTSPNQLHSIQFDISYVHGFQFSEIPLEVYITSPLHQINKTPFSLQLFDENANEIGDCVGDYCDLRSIIIKDYKFLDQGIYKIKVLHVFDHNYLPNVLSVSLQID
jgi:gliding motility-associated lipoprotein GldH